MADQSDIQPLETMDATATLKSLKLADGAEKPEEPNFPEEREGWRGYIEWEKYPEKRAQAEEILRRYAFPPVSLTDAWLNSSISIVPHTRHE